jgi:hypothetical protein
MTQVTLMFFGAFVWVSVIWAIFNTDAFAFWAMVINSYL